MKVSEIMVHPVIVVNEDATVEEIAKIMLDRRIGCVPIVDRKGKLVGIVTDSDFAAKERGFPFSNFFAPQLFGKWMPKEESERIYKEAKSLKAKEIMSTPVITVTEEDSMEEVVTKMLKHDFNRILVVRDGVPVGMVARHDLLKLILQQDKPE
ncbi:MAG TPA: CBS domain-containing protein [Thermodesulfobacteriota bacterium]|nr:CBS domain-containing protein [Thermodesulfobacteriota bacterium]